MSIVQTIDLNLIPSGNIQIINVSQYDTASKRLFFNLFYNGAPYTPEQDAVIKIRGLKPDRTKFEHVIDITDKVALEEDMTDIAGAVFCNIEITEGNNRTGTQAFILKVQKDAKGAI